MKTELIICDGDRTLVGNDEFGSAYSFLAGVFGILEEFRKHMKPWIARYDAAEDSERHEILRRWAEADARVYKGHNPKSIEAHPIPYMSGAADYFREIRNYPLVRAIVTSGPDIVYNRVARELGFQIVHANIFGIDENGLLDGTLEHKVGMNKPPIIKAISEETGIPLGNACYIGDSPNDREAMQLVKDRGGIAISVGDTYAEIVKTADAAITNFRELHEILKIQPN